MDNPAIDNINKIYDRDLEKKQGRQRFIDHSFEQKDRPYAGIAAFMMYNGSTLTGPGGMYGLHNDWDHAPGTEQWVNKDICILIAKKIKKLGYPIHTHIPRYEINFKASFQPHCCYIPKDSKYQFASDLTLNLKDIMDRYPNFIFTQMYIEHRIRKPNVCFPDEPQTIYDYLSILFQFVSKKGIEYRDGCYAKAVVKDL